MRYRFVSTLGSKIEDVYKALSDLSDIGSAKSVGKTYHSIHSIVGLGPTVGFPSTGRAALAVEEVLRAPYHNKRGLTADEILLLKKRLHALREAASREMQFVYSA